MLVQGKKCIFFNILLVKSQVEVVVFVFSFSFSVSFNRWVGKQLFIQILFFFSLSFQGVGTCITNKKVLQRKIAGKSRHSLRSRANKELKIKTKLLQQAGYYAQLQLPPHEPPQLLLIQTWTQWSQLILTCEVGALFSS